MAWVQENGVRAGKKINEEEEEEVVEEWQSKRKNKGGRKEVESSKLHCVGKKMAKKGQNFWSISVLITYAQTFIFTHT